FEVDGAGLEHRFRLRPDALWSDGTAVTADDFVFTYARMREERVSTVHLLDDVGKVVAEDERTLTIVAREARSYFLYLLAQPASFPWPRHVHEARGARWHVSKPHVGNGAFVLKHIGKESATLVASPTWHGARGNIREVDVPFASSVGDV